MNPHQPYDAEDLAIMEKLRKCINGGNTAPKNSPLTQSAPAPAAATTVENQQTPPATKPPQTHHDAATDPKQNHHTAGTNPPHTSNDGAPKSRPPHAGHHSQIDDLPHESRLKIEQTLEQTSLNNAVQILAQDPPEGLGIRFSRDTLHRFRQRLRREQRRAEADEARATAAALLDDPNLTDEQITAAGRHIIRVRLLEQVMDPTSTLERALALQLQADRLRITDLAERRLILAEQKQQAGAKKSQTAP